MPLKTSTSLPVWNPDLGIKAEYIPLFPRPYITEIWGAEIVFLGTGQITVDWMRAAITTTSWENAPTPIEFEDARNIIIAETKVSGSPEKLVMFPDPIVSVAERAIIIIGASATETAAVGAIGRLYIKPRLFNNSDLSMYLDENLNFKKTVMDEPVGLPGD